MLNVNQYLKSDKTPSIIYADLKVLIKSLVGVKVIFMNYQQQK